MTRRMNALIVDDDAAVRKLIMDQLNQTGLAEFVFAEARDGIDALEKYRPDETEIIFVDMNMPRMGGIDFIRKLHSLYKSCPPAVMITAESDGGRLSDAAQEAGVEALLLKPVDKDRLRTGLKTLVASIPERSGVCAVPHGECVSEAMQYVIAKACDLQLTPEPPDEAVRSGNAMLGMISMVGDLQWTVVLGFARDAAEAVASSFAGSETSSDELELGDAIGEITNIVAGRIKTLLSSRGLAVSFSLPTVISTSGLRFLVQRTGTTAANYAHFHSPVGKLWTVVTVGIHAGMVL